MKLIDWSRPWDKGRGGGDQKHFFGPGAPLPGSATAKQGLTFLSSYKLFIVLSNPVNTDTGGGGGGERRSVKRGLTVFRCVNLQNRMWRKTRSQNADTSCIGTDPNRNWNFAWAGTHIVTKTSFLNFGGLIFTEKLKTQGHPTSITGKYLF